MKPWVKLHTEIVRDLEIFSMSWQEKATWCLLLALAGEVDSRDENNLETGRVNTIPWISWRLGMPEDEARAAIAKFIELGMVEIDDEIVCLINYPKRQARLASETMVATRERQRKSRASRTLPPKRTGSNLALVSELAEYGILSPSDALLESFAKLKRAAGSELFGAVMAEARRSNPEAAMRPAYVSAILARCQEEGAMPDGTPLGKEGEQEATRPRGLRNPVTGDIIDN